MELRMTCKNCDWQGDQQEIIWDDRGFAMCPKCHQKVVFIQELRDIRIEEKLDKIIALLVTIGVEKAIKETAFLCPMCVGRKQVDLDEVGLWSPGDAERYGDCPLCDGDGFVVKREKGDK